MFHIQGQRGQVVKALALGQAFLLYIKIQARILPYLISTPFLKMFFLIFSELVGSLSNFTNSNFKENGNMQIRFYHRADRWDC